MAELGFEVDSLSQESIFLNHLHYDSIKEVFTLSQILFPSCNL